MGLFPALLPDIGRTQGLSDVELGALAGAFGLARALSDVPVGAFAARALGRALVAAPLALLAGVLCLAGGGSFPLLLLGRGLVGIGHSLSILAGLTVILRLENPGRTVMSLNVFEFGGMLGIVAGILLARVLPVSLSWRVLLLAAAVPHVLGLALVPAILRTLSALPSGRRPAEPVPVGRGRVAGGSSSRDALLLLGAVMLIAVTWSAATQFVIPLRGTRQFGLDRAGIARVLLLAQLTDTICLLPVGRFADRFDARRLLAAVMLLFGAGILLVSFGPVPLMVIGAVVLGVAIAGWMLPLVLLRRASGGSLARRTALYRVAADSGVFLGPFVPGLLGEPRLGITSVAIGVLLALGAVLFLADPVRSVTAVES